MMENSILTPREYEVTELTARGLSMKEVADYLGISTFTAMELVKRAKEKLHLQKSTELVAWYYISNNHIHLSVNNRLRRFIAAALLALSVFSVIMHTTELLRVFRAPQAQRVQQSRARRARRSDDFMFSEN